jgi:CDP-diacylglycerol--glycerol-3-phosphate 3-phosphatidyltransferase
MVLTKILLCRAMIIKDIPNMLTIGRVSVLPIFILSFYLDDANSRLITFAIFVLASITDYFDGYLARILKAKSALGMVLDPIADKLLVACSLMMLVHLDRAPIIPSILILCREIIVSGLREFLAEFKVSLPVTKLAKAKTFLQLFAIALLLLDGNRAGYVDFLGSGMLWFAASITLITGYAYCKEGYRYLITQE